MAKRRKAEEPQLNLPVHTEEKVTRILDGVDDPKPSAESLKPEVSTIIAGANAIEISNHSDNAKAGALLQGIKAMRKKVAEMLDPVVKRAHEAWKATVALRDSFDKPLENCEKSVKEKVRAFLDHQEQLRREEEQRRNAEAQKEAEEKAEQEAMLLEAIGEEEAAAVVLATPVIAAPVIIAEVPKPEHVTRVQNWKGKIVNPALIPDEYWILDTAKINAVCRAMKEATNIPGVEAYDAGTVRVG